MMSRLAVSSRAAWMIASTLVVLALAGLTIQRAERRSLERLVDFLGFALPSNAVLADYKDDFALFDCSQSWLIRLPATALRPWEDSGSYRKCEFTAQASEDYQYVLGIVHDDFPASRASFRQPRIWIGGRDGNCYIVLSDDGELCFFRYFTT